MLFAMVVGTVVVFWGGYQGAKRVPVAGALVAVLLLIAACYLLRLNLSASSLGDGAPSSAGAALGLIWLVRVLIILLAGTLLAAGWRERRHALSGTLFVGFFVPVAIYAVIVNVPRRKTSTASPPVGAEVSREQQGSKKDGYLWALDSQFMSEDECRSGTPDFLLGCREGVAANRARAAR